MNRPSEEQLEKLLTILEANESTINGKFSSTVTKKSKDAVWDVVSRELNLVNDGCRKSPQEWKQVCIIMIYSSTTKCVFLDQKIQHLNQNF